MGKLPVIIVVALVQLINACEYTVTRHNITFARSKVQLQLSYQYPNGLQYTIVRDGKTIQTGVSNDDLSANIKTQEITNGIKFTGYGKEVSVSLVADESDYAEVKIVRNMVRGQMSRDCYHMENDTYWYGGAQQKTQQFWPINSQRFVDYSYVTKEADSQAVNERYWLNSKGVFIWVTRETPLFITQSPNVTLCFKAEKRSPYNMDLSSFTFQYHIGISSDPQKAHMKAISKFLFKPTAVVDDIMVEKPIWSTWAVYKKEIDQAKVLAFAKEIHGKGFAISQIEVDDMWETCYGSLTIDTNRFSNMEQLIKDIKALNPENPYRVTLWIHPFVQKDCTAPFNEGMSKGYFVTNSTGHVATQWWNSLSRGDAAYIDFTNQFAAKWFVDKVKALKAVGFDGFKFDAGETTWGPPDPVLYGKKELFPELLTTAYINAVSELGPITEVRAAQGNQKLPIFMRMIDKDSSFDYNNGLPTLVTTLLQLNMNGYPFVLPDMIGGNGYDTTGKPNYELFMRWLEANVFMPSLQFSYLPWDADYVAEDADVEKKAIALIKLHMDNKAKFTAAMAETVRIGTPINPPIWWIAPTDQVALSIGDQFLLGTDIIVAPILVQGATTRRVYLPTGQWKDGNNAARIEAGPKWVDYTAQIGTIPYFVKQP